MSGEKVDPTRLSYADFLGTFTVEDQYTFVQGPLTELHFEYIEEVERLHGAPGKVTTYAKVRLRVGKYEFTFTPDDTKVLWRGRVQH